MSNSKKLKGGLIGVGRMGLTHLSILNSYDNVEIVGLVDNNKSVLNVVSKHMNISCYSQSDQMFDSLNLDFIIIATPPGYHYSDIKKGLINNLNIFVEKPFVMDNSHGQELIEMISNKKLINQVGYVIRYNESFLKVKELISRNIIGKIFNFKSEMYGATVQASTINESWRDDKNIGGGCIREFASHAIDLAFFCFGNPKKIVGSTVQKVFSKNTEDIINTTFIYENNLIGTISANWCDSSYRKPSNKLTIFGEKGSVIADKFSVKIFLKNKNDEMDLNEGWNTLYLTDIFNPVDFYLRGNEYSRQLETFINSISNKTNFIGPSFRESYEVDLAINRIIEDSRL